MFNNLRKCGRTFILGLCFFLLTVNCAADNSYAIHEDITPAYLKAPLLLENPNLDPSATWEYENSYLLSALYDSLFTYSKDGEVLPNLALSLPEISNDGKQYQISIRKDAVFSDDPCFKGGKGRSVSAADVIFSIKRIADPSNESGLWSLIAGRIAGLDEFRQRLETKKGTIDDPVEGLVAKNENELEIKLLNPSKQFVYILGMTEFGIVPREAVEKYGNSFPQHPLGTGPFQFKYCDNKNVLLERRPNHWRFDFTKSGVSPDGIAFSFYDDPFSAFKSGDLDFMLIPPNRLHSYLDESFQLKRDVKQKGYNVLTAASPANYYLFFNYEEPIVNNAELRRAISLAVPWHIVSDKTDLCHASFVPRGITGHVDMKYEWNPGKAKEALKRAGYPDGQGLPELIIRFTDYGIMLRHAGMVEDALEAVGISTRIDFSEEDIEGAHLGFFGWIMDYPDAENFLVQLDSRAIPPEGENNGHYTNTAYDILLDRASLAVGEERIKIYQKAVRLIYEDVAAIPFRQPVEYWALGPRIINMECMFGYISWPRILMHSVPKSSE